MVIAKRIRRESEKFLGVISNASASDIPALGKCLNFMDNLPLHILPEDHPVREVVPVIKRYIERLIFEEEKDIDFLVSCVEKFCFTDDYNEKNIRDILAGLALKNEPDWFSDMDTDVSSSPENTANGQDVTDEDQQIVCEFITESLDSIDALEFSLVAFEENPGDSDVINAIFRIFHTIKGVSGFLNLNEINSLSHSTENLLDEIRQGSIRVAKKVIDVIFESVDTLKRMILEIRDNIESGSPWTSSAISIKGIKHKIAAILQASGESDDMPIGEILVVKGIVKKEDLDEGLEIQKKNPGKKLGEILVENKKADAEAVSLAVKNQERERSQASNQVSSQVKIDTSKLDSLVDLTGELVIAQSMMRQYSQKYMDSDPQFYKFISQLSSSVSGIQKIAMNMRMVPIRSTFQKMVRVIRDLSKSSGKEIILQMTGEETEIDRNMVDALYEPMVHMIRNSADHGLELADERVAKGKTPYGTVFLRAFHKGGNIVIEIEDDGRGLNKGKITEKAVSKGLIQSSENMTDEQIYGLIFEPGFSTASSITDISGRGVGMDVVKQSIEKMKGHISIDSVEGMGCTFTMALPLTLGIIEGMVIRSGTEKYIIPTLSVLESFRPDKNDYKTSFERGEMLLVRNSLIPFVRLGSIFGTKSDIENPWDGIVIVIENKGRKIGLFVDDILGKDEFVIKSLGDVFRGIKGIAGGSIVADGRVALIMDVSGLFDKVFD
ncbi:chemotaxis protein CheA [Desulforegula conservatrix]|uniref:chemotaxis protein CheA n=1 Tax=Desulforegula conservatrix TaxID=153026 RepID=UPI00041DBCC9|nr:chemotaxis protein CheA [Desulforegula conservatrix]